MKKELSQLARIASEFEAEGNLGAGRLITIAMKKIAQEGNTVPYGNQQTLTNEGEDPGTTRNIEQLLYLMVQRARGGDERASSLLRDAANKYSGFEAEESEWMRAPKPKGPLTGQNEQGYVSPGNPMNPALFGLEAK